MIRLMVMMFFYGGWDKWVRNTEEVINIMYARAHLPWCELTALPFVHVRIARYTSCLCCRRYRESLCMYKI